MFILKTLNAISPKGLSVFNSDNYRIDDTSKNPDGIILRSSLINTIPERVIAIARAGSGVNNIPLEECTKRGIIVFNTPGANANSVKELVISGMLLSNRKVIEGINWTRSLSGSENVEKLIEQRKKNFSGPEIKGKKLTVIGLGAIGAIVANAAVDLGMEVFGYDPYISIDSAWGLRSQIIRVNDLESSISDCDFISLHIPLLKNSQYIINRNLIANMKRGVRILNFSRGALVNDEDMIQALNTGKVSRYITDFPNEVLLSHENVLPTPHLGASTPEAEENCAVMACTQIRNYFETGHIKNSVNFPRIDMDINTQTRLVILNKNIPSMVGQITNILAEEKTNISGMINNHHNDVAVTIINIDEEVSAQIINRLKNIEGIIRIRVIRK